MTKQIHLAVQFPGLDDTTGGRDSAAGSHVDFSSLAHLARVAERGRFDFLLLAEELPPRQRGGAYPDTLTTLAALTAVTDRLGLGGTINPTFQEPYELARQLATLDHLSAGRSAWHVATSWDAYAGDDFRRGGYLPQVERLGRAGAFVRTVGELLDSWHRDDIVADKTSGVFLRRPRPGTFVHRDGHFDIAGQFNVPCSPQGRPVIIYAGDSEEDREFAAAAADAIISPHCTLSAARAFYTDVKSRLARHGRRRDELLVLPTVSLVIGDTDAEADEVARDLVIDVTGRVSFVGSAATVAGAIDEFARAGASDGFLLIPHGTSGLDAFVAEVVPLLQQRGVFRTDYDGATLREHLSPAGADPRAVRAAS